ncbi:MAG TPA: hypothetical protein VMT29_15945 [Steroidobacteraceae bacterium]|nr:hypothetical protein [Steroidobacteraceae bacterium]
MDPTLHWEKAYLVSAFRLVKHRTELHQTPTGSTRQFTYSYCRIGEERG